MADQQCPHSVAAYMVSDSQPLRGDIMRKEGMG